MFLPTFRRRANANLWAVTRGSETDRTETYLDWAASTPMRPEAVQAYLQACEEGFANPSGSHPRAQRARRIIDEAREQVADVIGCEPSDVIFGGGGTEANNLAISGVHSRLGGTVSCVATEHPSVLKPVAYHKGSTVGVSDCGRIDLDSLETLARESVHTQRPLSLFSAMTVNNETGVIQDLGVAAQVLKEHCPDALLHTDAVQGFVWLDLTERTKHCDLISISGHKFGGPKGVGALVVRDRNNLYPHIRGGGQEFELRSGTQNVAGIAALGAACVAAAAQRSQMVERVGSLRKRLVSGLVQRLDGVVETAPETDKVEGIVQLCFEGIESEPLLFAMSRQGVCASAASSCASGAQDPSHVLAAMGYSRELAGSSLRLSLGYGSTEADIDRALEVIPPLVENLRNFAL